jgi:hypothetical protein
MELEIHSSLCPKLATVNDDLVLAKHSIQVNENKPHNVIRVSDAFQRLKGCCDRISPSLGRRLNSRKSFQETEFPMKMNKRGQQ